MSDKNVSIKVPGADGKGEQMLSVAIAPGVTAADIMRKLGKDPIVWLLSVPGGKVFAQNEQVYGQVEDGGKLVLTPKMEAGGNTPAFFADLKTKLDELVYGWAQGNRVKVAPGPSRFVVRVTPGNLVRVEPTPVPTWQEQGWRLAGADDYRGKYVTPYGAWAGRILAGPFGVSQVLISNPPDQIRFHPHFECFIHKGGDCFELHWATPLRNVDEAIVNTERILSEAHEWAGAGWRQGYAVAWR